MKIAILGANGYTGSILLKLLLSHPNISTIFAFSDSQANIKIEDSSNKIYSNAFISYNKLHSLDFDVLFSALPHLISSEYYADLIDKKVIIDLAADLRFESKDIFYTTYGKLPKAEQFIGKASYGLTEWNHDQILTSNLIAVPGCYPTVSLMSILPMLKETKVVSDIIVNAMSGHSGAGKKASVDLLFSERTENTNVYSPGSQHRHHAEILEKIAKYQNDVNLSFNPHLIPTNRGIYSSITMILNDSISEAKINQIYSDTYENHTFVNILPIEKLQLRNVIATNNCNISISMNKNHLQVFACIDNLMKGAAGAAIQNFNLRFGFSEITSLPLNNLL